MFAFGKRSRRAPRVPYTAHAFRPRAEQLEVREVPAVAIQSLVPSVGVLEGTAVSGPIAVLTGTSTNAADYSATVNWGDGTVSACNAANGGIVDNGDGTFSVVASNTYAEQGNKTIIVKAADAAGGSATQSATVSVGDAPLTGSYQTIFNGVPKSPLGAGPLVIATFTDANPGAPASDFTATIAWGDGTTDTASGVTGSIVADPNFPGQWNVLGNHTYPTTGAYQVTVTVQDIGGETTTVTTPVIVANPSPLQVTSYDPATPLSTLTDALVKPGTGLNVVGTSFVGQNGQAGTYTGFNFHDQNTSLTLTDGILLTSGSAINAIGPNNQTGATTAYGTVTDPMGNAQLGAMVAPDITYDANTFTIQFTTDPGVTGIQFQFVFGSEEFPEWVGQYNDVFAAFLDGKQISFDPNSHPISVNNDYFLLNNSNDNTYPQYAVGKTVVAFDIQYDGLTPALTTQAALDPTITTHTLTFAIADTRDQVLDSGVFLTSLAGVGSTAGGGSSGGSSASGPVTTPAPQANAGGPYQVTAGGTVQLNGTGTTDAAQNPATLTYQWDLNGNGIYGETGAAATNGNEVGIKPTFVAAGLTGGTAVTVSLQVTNANGVVSTDQATINVVAPPPAPPMPGGGQVSIDQGPGGANTLLVYGTDGNDSIRVEAADKGAVKVIVNGLSQGTFAKGGFSAIAVYGLAGNDKIQVEDDVKYTVYLFGGDGNDLLVGGGGPSFLSGGAGNDKLVGGDAASVLIGGAGSDSLSAGDNSALMIAGTTDFDTRTTSDAYQQIADLLAVWASPNKKFTERSAAAQSHLTGHVGSDGAKDSLAAGDLLGLFYLDPTDVLHEKKKGDVVVS